MAKVVFDSNLAPGALPDVYEAFICRHVYKRAFP
jgi:hypothetical protein